MSTIAELDKDLNQKLLSGKMMEAFEQYYADDVVMQENSDAPCAGKDANRKRELDFVTQIQEVHGFALADSAVSDDTSFSQWSSDVTFKNGFRFSNTQVAVRKWKNGKIVHERFFYSKPN